MLFLHLAALLVAVVSIGAINSLRPLVIWHGLGDSHSSPGMLEFQDMIREVHPGIFIHSVSIADALDKDREATFYGNINSQLELVSKQLASIPQLADGFDALGFSQGGQFLRAYVHKYNQPPVNNLITFGSQHMGISDIPACSRFDLGCRAIRSVLKGAVYGDWAQSNLVQAQYFRDPARLETYLEASQFLAVANNEIPGSRNTTYARNLASLNSLVLILFTDDKTVIPKESAWFGSVAVETKHLDSSDQTVFTSSRDATIPMRAQPLYTEDWIGLRELDERGGVIFDTCQGEHMDISSCWERFVRGYTGRTA